MRRAGLAQTPPRNYRDTATLLSHDGRSGISDI
jgi:hypothetical protein